MNERLRRYLDGELPLEALSPDERAEAEAWEGLLVEVRERLPSGAPPGLEPRVLDSLAAEPRHGARPASGWAAFRDWLVRPRPVPISPLGAATVAAALLVLILRPWEGPAPEAGPAGPSEAAPAVAGGEAEPTATRIYVEFVLRAPDASSVSVAGDFNEWTPTLLEDVDGDGVWSGRIRLQPGVHEYMFVLDGSTWVTDPNAERYADDGFGNRNAVLAVAPGGA